MTVLYVKDQGATVRRDVEQIKVTRPKERQRQEAVLAKIAVRELEQVVVWGNVQLTTQAAALLLQHEVDVVFLSLYGVYRGHLSRNGSKFARLRHQQLALTGDEQRSLTVAKQIVQAKLANQRNLLLRLQQWAADAGGSAGGEAGARLRQAAEAIERMRSASLRAASPDALRGFEGKAATYYFGVIKTLLDPKWSFERRAYYPPPDPFNALLSFGYSLLLKDMTATIHLVGLDPYLGCFHALEYDRPSLTLDLMEEFRPLVVDQVIFDLALDGKLTPGEFIYTGRPERPVELGHNKTPLVIQAYEKRLDAIVAHTESGANQRLRRCLELQARIFARLVLGQRNDYQGVVG